MFHSTYKLSTHTQSVLHCISTVGRSFEKYGQQKDPSFIGNSTRTSLTHLFFCRIDFTLDFRMRITITIDWSTRFFIPLPGFFNSRRPAPLLSLILLEFYLGWVIMSQWSDMWRQEWGIETSFRLRIMDHLPNKFLSLWVVLFLTWGTHTLICWNLFKTCIPVNIICKPIELAPRRGLQIRESIFTCRTNGLDRRENV